MFFILIFVFVFAELSKRIKIIKWIVFVFPAFVILDNAVDSREIMTYDKKNSQLQIEAVKKEIQKQFTSKHNAIAFMPTFIESEAAIHLNTMLAAQELNIPCINAYTGHHPPAFNDFFARIDKPSMVNWCNYSGININTIQEVSDIGRKIVDKKLIHLKAYNKKFVSADKSIMPYLIANRNDGYLWETFTLINFDNNECAFVAHNNLFLTPELDLQNQITVSRKALGLWETFKIIRLDSNYFAFKTHENKYLSINYSDSILNANSDSIGIMEKFKILETQ